MSSSDDKLRQDSDILGDKINKAQQQYAPKYAPIDSSPKKSPLSIAIRSGVELVSGMLVGVGLGMLCDYIFNSQPIGMVIFLFLGMAAGVTNIYRSMKNIL